MNLTSVDSLSPELVYLILLEVSTLKDLSSIICASAQFYRTFVSFKTTILFTVLQRVIHPDVLSDALAVVAASDITKTIEEGNIELIRPGLLHFLQRYGENRNKRPYAELRDQYTLSCLCRLHTTVEFFLSDYINQSLASLCRHSQRAGSCCSDDSFLQESQQISDVDSKFGVSCFMQITETQRV